MSRQGEAWNAWPADAPPYDPYAATRRYTSDPRVSRAILENLLEDRGPGRHAFDPAHGPSGYPGPAAMRETHLIPEISEIPEWPGTRRRPAAVRSSMSPRRTRRPGGRRPGTRRKVRPRDPLLAARLVWAVTRIVMGLIFLWTFADRLAGLDRPVAASHAWLNGGSPTRGYLATAEGPFAAYFHAMAGRPWTDWLFMLGLAGVGLALVLGVGMRVAAVCGVALMTLVYLAGLPVESNPLLDQHIVYALVITALALSRAGDTIGLGTWWSRTRLVQAVPALR